MIPGTFAYVYLGSAAAGAASGEADATKKIVQIAGAVVALVVTIFVARVATKAIKSAGVAEAQPGASRRKRPEASFHFALSERTDTFRISGGWCEMSSRRRGSAGRGPVPVEDRERAVPLADLVHPSERGARAAASSGSG